MSDPFQGGSIRQLESGAIEGIRLCVEFANVGDRFAHRVLARLDEGAATGVGDILIATSLEGDDTADWPPSPPLQQIEECPLADGRNGLVGVGMAGRAHWSISVETAAASTGLATLEFDVACRAAEFGLLASNYQLVDGLRSKRLGETFLIAIPDLEAAGVRVELTAAAPLGVLGDSGDASAPDEAPECGALTVVPAFPKPDVVAASGATVRWKYRFELSS